MADANTKTGAPSRARKPVATKAAPAAAKAAPTKAPQKAAAAPKTTRVAAKPKAAEPVVEENTAPKDADGREKVLVEFEYSNTTKSFDVFKPTEESGVKGSLYVPHGTEEVRALLFIADED